MNGTDFPDCSRVPQPQWCRDQWCYVSLENCEVNHEPLGSQKLMGC